MMTKTIIADKIYLGALDRPQMSLLVEKISLEEAKELMRGSHPLVSSCDFRSAGEIIRRTGIIVPVQTDRVRLEDGDELIVFDFYEDTIHRVFVEKEE